MANKLFYYSEITGELVGQGVAALDPIEGKPLVPRNSTLTEPEQAAENQINVFDEATKTWSLTDDFRGYIGYSQAGELQEINTIGIKPDASWTLERPYIHAEQQEIQRDAIRQAFFSASTQNVTDANGVAWSGGFDSAIKLDAARRLATEAGLTSVSFYDADNIEHVLTLEQAKVVTLTVSADYQTKLAKKQALFKQISEATTKQQLDWVVW
jgi:hypothetical protein